MIGLYLERGEASACDGFGGFAVTLNDEETDCVGFDAVGALNWCVCATVCHLPPFRRLLLSSTPTFHEGGPPLRARTTSHPRHIDWRLALFLLAPESL